jgi:hypothetical protein
MMNDISPASDAALEQHGVMPVPVIDMSLPEDVAAKQLRQACIDVGFFYRECLHAPERGRHVFTVPSIASVCSCLYL